MAKKEEKDKDTSQDLSLTSPDKGNGDKEVESPDKSSQPSSIEIDGVTYTPEEIRKLKQTKEDKETEIEQKIQEINILKAEKVKAPPEEEDIFANKEKLAERMYDDPQGVLDAYRQKIEKELETKFNAKMEATISPILQGVREDQKAKLREKYPKDFDAEKEKEVDKIFTLLRPDMMRGYLISQGYKNVQALSDYELAYQLHNLANGILPGGSVVTFSEKAKRHAGAPPSTEEKLAEKGFKPDEIDTIKRACKEANITLEEYLAMKENPEKDYDNKR